ncbi:MAG: hypothetical protein PVSMB4_14200 [Ktedonobacterales bacterium]
MIPVLKWGAIVGVVVYVAELLLTVVYTALAAGGTGSVTDRPVLLVPICLQYFALLFAFSAAGFYTGRETGRAGLGALAGVVALVVQFVFGQIYAAVTAAHPAAPSAQAGLNPAALVLAQIVAAILVLGLAASMGWLGGRPGAQQYARRARPADGTPSDTDRALPRT